MPLTPAQRTTLLADIQANGDANAIYQTGDLDALAALYNQPSSPAFIVWRTNVTLAEVKSVLVWSEYDALSVSKQNAFDLLVRDGQINASLANVRGGITSIYSGPSQAGNLAALVAVAKRTATRVERVFATGTGTTGSPGTLTFEGFLSSSDLIGL